MKFGKDSDQWPKDSLKRSLLMNFPGCKSPLEALELIKSQKSQTALQLPVKNEIYELMKDAIRRIELELNGFDIDEMNSDVRAQFANLPLITSADMILWRDGWLDFLRGMNEFERNKG